MSLGPTGHHRGRCRGPLQERGRPRLRGVPALGPAAGPALPRSRARPPSSRGPGGRTPARTRSPDAVEDADRRIRKELDQAGHEAGAATIALPPGPTAPVAPRSPTARTRLGLDDLADPDRRGFVTPQPHKRPRSSWHRFEADQPNERWQADITHWRLADGTEVEILNLLDDHSRLALASDAAAAPSTAPTSTTPSTDAFARYGESRPACSPTTAPSSPAYRAAAAGSPSSRTRPPRRPVRPLPRPTTRRPAARSNASTRP